MTVTGSLAQIGHLYRRFAENEAEGRCALYADISRHIAEDEAVLGFLAELPPPKRQPNLLLASFRSLFGVPEAWGDFKEQLLCEPERLAARIRQRSTQTNEPARCATLLPLLAQLSGPLALIEVGAAAGLCLLPERYQYVYGDLRLGPEQLDENTPTFHCRANTLTPIPARMPSIAWRRGLDLNPLDLTSHEEMEWLEALVWPTQLERLSNLRKAIATARDWPPIVVRGDLGSQLEDLCGQAPVEATTVVFHSAVLNYVQSQSERDRFAATVSEIADHWIANESPMVFPQIAERAGNYPQGGFLMSLDGEPIAWTDPHGASVDWIR